MQRPFQRRGAIAFALLCSVMTLSADITLPSAAPSPPPQADDYALRLWRGGRATIPLRGHHRGSGTVTFWIVDAPAHGTLSELRLLGDNRATIVYQHDGAEPAANDRFTYLVKTSGNQVSSPAEVRIVLEEPPPHLQVPARIEFDQIVAGESQTRNLNITNDGGGVLEGRLTASAPWSLTSAQYRVESGKTAAIAVNFRPEEGREFVGQITLTGNDGALGSVVLAGEATSPVQLEPSELRIPPPREGKARRTASVTLTNRTDRSLTLKFVADQKIEPLVDVMLPPAGEKIIPVVIAADGTIPVKETILIRGDRFNARLPVVAESLPVSPAPPPSPPARVIGLASSPLPGAAIPVPAAVVRQAPPESPLPSATPGRRIVPVRGQRLERSVMELRWARPKEPVAQYRFEERFLALDGAGELQATWRALASPKITFTGDTVTAQIGGLDPRQIHSLKVTALAPDGTALWESPLVVLGPPAKPPAGPGWWTLLLGLALFGLVFLRWRANRASP